MSQAHGRNSGSRENGSRQPRRSSNTAPRASNTANKQANKPSNKPANKPVGKAQHGRDAANAHAAARANASIFKTRSFKLLVDAVGAENIALGLDSSLTRVTELMNGIGFTPETAFHIETTLGLPEGFFDQPNPVLRPEIVTRLKSPLDFVQASVEQERFLDLEAPQDDSDEHVPKEAQMPKKTNGDPQRAVATNVQGQPGKPVVKPSASKPGEQQSLPLTEDVSVEKIRRANLHVLTSRNGSKARLSALMALSGSNMAHRLHGQKRLDDAEANRFTERLGLPAGWLDVARTAAEIPANVTALLVPSRRAGSVHDETGGRGSREQPGSPDVSNEAADVATQPASGLLAATQLDHLHGIQPIAEALLKTLAGKARAGLLDEAKALEMLQQAVLL